MPQEPIVVIDNFLHPDTFRHVAAELTTLHHWQPEVDFPGAAPVGETCDLPNTTQTYRAIVQELKKLFPAAWVVDRFYVNRFQPREVPQFHQDGEVVTCVFYADPGNWTPHDHGETQVLINAEIRGILPLPNRMLVFDGRLLHRATSFQTRRRHTIAAKLEGVTLADIVLPGAESAKQ
jgi:hypothetical protein